MCVSADEAEGRGGDAVCGSVTVYVEQFTSGLLVRASTHTVTQTPLKMGNPVQIRQYTRQNKWFSLREWSYRLYSLGRLCRLAQNMCQFIILMAVPLFLEFSGKAECRATFQFSRLFV